MKGRIRWAIFTALFSLALAIAIGVAAFVYSDEETMNDEETSGGPVQGNYAFRSTNLIGAVPNLPGGQAPQVVVTGGRLSVGADSHVFWSLEMHSILEPARTGRLSCEGTYIAAAVGPGHVAPSPQYGYVNFPPNLDARDSQQAIVAQFCRGTGPDLSPAAGPFELTSRGSTLEMRGRGGTILWRRE